MQGKNSVTKFENSRREARKELRKEKNFDSRKRNKTKRGNNERWDLE